MISCQSDTFATHTVYISNYYFNANIMLIYASLVLTTSYSYFIIKLVTINNLGILTRSLKFMQHKHTLAVLKLSIPLPLICIMNKYLKIHWCLSLQKRK